MDSFRKIYLSLIVVLLWGCGSSSNNKDILTEALESQNPKIKDVLDHKEAYEIQIRYTEIHREGDSIWFEDFDFQVEEYNYFYPASTVKLPVALGALIKLQDEDYLDLNTPFFVEGDTSVTTFRRSVESIFAISDNKSNNDLVEYSGFDALNDVYENMGVEPFRISHRLSTSNADNPTTKSLIYVLKDSTLVQSKPTSSELPEPLPLAGIQKGRGYYSEEKLIEHPFDFSLKNYFPIKSQSALMKRIFFPEAFPISKTPKLSKEYLDFLRGCMGALPHELGYDRKEYYDSYGKFFIFGDSSKNIPDGIKIYNKVGYAYGTLTDMAYIKDDDSGVDFFLHATILVNADGIFNDDIYEFEEVGIPFLAELGREVLRLRKQKAL